MKRLFAVIIGCALLPLSVALAQELPTVMYEGVPIEVEPDKGPVQGCVVEVVTTENYDGKSITTTGIIIALNTDKWIVTGVFNDTPLEGAPGSHFGDCFHMAWDVS